MLSIGDKLPNFLAALCFNPETNSIIPYTDAVRPMLRGEEIKNGLIVCFSNMPFQIPQLDSFAKAIEEGLLENVYFLVNYNQTASLWPILQQYPFKPFKHKIYGIFTPHAKDIFSDRGTPLNNCVWSIKDGVVDDIYRTDKFGWPDEFAMTENEKALAAMKGIDAMKVIEHLNSGKSTPAPDTSSVVALRQRLKELSEEETTP